MASMLGWLRGGAGALPWSSASSCRFTRRLIESSPEWARSRARASRVAIDLFRAWGREGGKKGPKARWAGGRQSSRALGEV
jgi:hypothetical protein